MLAVLIGVCIGILAALLGIGGGVLFVPTLILVFGLGTREAIGTSLLAVLVGSISSTFAYYRQRRIDYRLGVMLGLVGIPGVVLGAYLVMVVAEKYLCLAFSVVLILTAIDLAKRKNKDSHMITFGDDCPAITRSRILMACFFAFFGGIVTGALGIGGGVVNVPIMIIILGIPIHVAVATSCFIVLIRASIGTCRHMSYGNIVAPLGLALGIGAVLGTQMGARIAKRTKPRVLRVLFSLLLVGVGIRMIFEAL